LVSGQSLRTGVNSKYSRYKNLATIVSPPVSAFTRSSFSRWSSPVSLAKTSRMPGSRARSFVAPASRWASSAPPDTVPA
jgi:hypothetical protein